MQVNTTGMLTMAVHDISKISPPVLCKQLSIGCTRHLLHLSLFTLAHPADRCSIFSLWDDGGLFTPFTLFFFLSGEAMGIPCLQDKQTTGSHAIGCVRLVKVGGTRG